MHWSLRGAEPRTLIGRMEQTDTMHALSSTYACANCCPDSFVRGFVAPDSITGFPGDQTLCDAMEVDENCYGALMEPFSVSAIWSSDNTGVATIESSGLATAQNVGSAQLRAQLRTFVYVDTGPFGCESGRWRC